MKRPLDWDKYLETSARAVSGGIVMLKNDGALPLKQGGTAAVFGRIQLHYYKSGTGSGGMVNSNVLHRTQSLKNGTALRLQLFEAELLAGVPGGTVQQRYITPLVQRPGLELLALSPEVPGQAAALDLLRQSLYLDEDAFGYELRLQALLSEVWLAFVQQLPQLAPAAPGDIARRPAA